jgi:hypothetical protein
LKDRREVEEFFRELNSFWKKEKKPKTVLLRTIKYMK